MIDVHSVPLFLTLPIGLAGGLALGFAYFSAVRATADQIVRGGPPLLGLILIIGRLALLSVGLYVAVLAGGLVLLAVLAGVLCAKALILLRTQPVNT